MLEQGLPNCTPSWGGERQHSQCALPSSHLHGDTWAGSPQWHTVTRGGGHSQYALPSCTSSPGRCHLKAYLWASLCRTSRKNGQSQAGPSNERVFLWRRKKQTRGTCADTRVWRERCLFCSKEQAFWEHDYLLVLARNFNITVGERQQRKASRLLQNVLRIRGSKGTGLWAAFHPAALRKPFLTSHRPWVSVTGKVAHWQVWEKRPPSPCSAQRAPPGPASAQQTCYRATFVLFLTKILYISKFENCLIRWL